MRSWENRADTFVCDEPLYAHYLRRNGRTDHPGYQETLAHHEDRWDRVIQWLTGPIPHGQEIFYQKQMAHHLPEGQDLGWIDGMLNCLLIRDPRDVLASLAEFLPTPSAADTGLPQQLRLWKHVEDKTGETPPIFDSRDILEDPRRALTEMCRAADVNFQEAMLRWPPGLRPTDGAWAPFWYNQVKTSTGFRPFANKETKLPDRLIPVWESCQPLYERLFQLRIRPPDNPTS